MWKMWKGRKRSLGFVEIVKAPELLVGTLIPLHLSLRLLDMPKSGSVTKLSASHSWTLWQLRKLWTSITRMQRRQGMKFGTSLTTHQLAVGSQVHRVVCVSAVLTAPTNFASEPMIGMIPTMYFVSVNTPCCLLCSIVLGANHNC
jgi:hypothetical protein